MKALFVQHKAQRCGVSSCGLRTLNALRWAGSGAFQWGFAACSSLEELQRAEQIHEPAVTMVNWHPAAISWIPKDFTMDGPPRAAIIHDDLRPEWAREFLGTYPFFKMGFWKCPAPSCGFGQDEVPGIHPMPRLVPPRPMIPVRPPVGQPRVALFGFGNADKLFEDAVKVIEESYPNARIACHFPSNDVVDKTGERAWALLRRVESFAKTAEVEPSAAMLNNTYMTDEDLIGWLSQSTVNLLMHGNHNSTSSSADLCMAAGVPFATNRSPFFRHLPEEIKLGPKTLREIAEQGIGPWRSVASWNWNGASHAAFIEEKLLEAIL